MAKLILSGPLLKKAKRWQHQTNRLDRVWGCVRQDSNEEKGKRMARVLRLRKERFARLGIIMDVLLMGVDE